MSCSVHQTDRSFELGPLHPQQPIIMSFSATAPTHGACSLACCYAAVVRAHSHRQHGLPHHRVAPGPEGRGSKGHVPDCHCPVAPHGGHHAAVLVEPRCAIDALVASVHGPGAGRSLRVVLERRQGMKREQAGG